MSDAPRIDLDEAPARKFYLVIDGRRQGPFAREELPEQGLEHDTLVWHTGMSEWLRADKVPALREVLLTIPPPLPELPPPLPRGRAATPASFQALHLWWMVLLGAAVALPLLGGLFLAFAQAEYGPRPSWPGVVYYDYSALGKALIALGGVLIGVGTLSLLASVVIFCVFLYKVWELIQDGHARTGPGLAVGLLFVPFFNCYWVFVAIRGLALDLHDYLRRHGPREVVPPSPALAVAFCVLFICSQVPYLQFLIIPLLVVLVLLMAGFKNAAVAIAGARRPARPALPLDDHPNAITERRPSPEAL
jgi:hypothetical protein